MRSGLTVKANKQNVENAHIHEWVWAFFSLQVTQKSYNNLTQRILKMTKSLKVIFCSFILLGCLPVLSFPQPTDESVTISTYYPSPYGVYSELRLFPRQQNPLCGMSTDYGGTLYYDEGTGIMYCTSGGPTARWERVGEPASKWEETPTGIQPKSGIDIVTVPELETMGSIRVAGDIYLAEGGVLYGDTEGLNTYVEQFQTDDLEVYNDADFEGDAYFYGDIYFKPETGNEATIGVTGSPGTIILGGNIDVTGNLNVAGVFNAASNEIQTNQGIRTPQIVFPSPNDSSEALLKYEGVQLLDGAYRRIVKLSGTGGSTLRVMGPVYSDTAFLTSDLRLKKNIASINSPLKRLLEARGVSFEWDAQKYPQRNFSPGRHYGVIAQEIEKIFPEIVSQDASGDRFVSYNELIPILIEAIKEQQKEIESLKQEVKALKAAQP